MTTFKKNILITGYSGGAGKSFLIKERIMPLVGNSYKTAISHTTRKPRGNEKCGEHYYFVEQIAGIAAAIAHHVQACFTAERVHHEAIDALDDLTDYDVTAGWPAQGQ